MLWSRFDSSQAFVRNQLNWCFKGTRERLRGVLLHVLARDMATGKTSEGRWVYLGAALVYCPL